MSAEIHSKLYLDNMDKLNRVGIIYIQKMNWPHLFMTFRNYKLYFFI